MDRIIDIQNYWTSLVKGIGDFKQIAVAENPEFNDLTGCLTILLADTFINDATENGVKRWEKILNIIPLPSQSLEDRKIKILTVLNIKLPYTYRMLENAVRSIFGEGKYTLSINNETSTLTLKAYFQTENQFVEVNNLFENVVPKNLDINIIRSDL